MPYPISINKETAEAAVLGGAVLGGGGGGWIHEGHKIARLALQQGFSEISSIESLPPEASLLTVSAVGAPSLWGEALQTEDYVRAVQLLVEQTGITISGLISNEVGAVAVVNGWLQSAALNLPLIDAPGNGRAHPTALMGSMGIHHKKDYVSLQAAVGGHPQKGNRVEVVFKGPLEEVCRQVREAAVRAGGMVAVARNPLPAGYIKEHGAPGAIAMAVEIGQICTRNRDADPQPIFASLQYALEATALIKGTVQDLRTRTEAGFDLGFFSLRESRNLYEVSFVNEYLTLETNGNRLATFPDLIMTFDASTAVPLISAELKEEQEIVLLTAPAHRLILGAGMHDRDLLTPIATLLGKKL